MLNLLKTHFGYDNFRPGQEKIIKHILGGNDSLVLMPTGGGKSLCFQLPALKLDGLTLVISPLISLMKDQVDSLRANGISAEFINSSLDFNEINRIQATARAGETKILYLAPERLAVASFLEFLRTLSISLIAIDEAHCISEWGHDFRPDYRNLRILKKYFPDVPTTALTATATQKVRRDIVSQLGLAQAKIFLTSFNRPNLTYSVVPKRHAFDRLVGLIEKYKGEAVIIYCFSRKETENVAVDLRAEGFKALPYHAGLEMNTRKEAQEKFIRDEARIIVATIAFGMGIDKPDVRLVVHYSLPKSIEGYYQETGRAGRDGLPSECVLFYSFGDTKKHYYFINELTNMRERENTIQKLNEVVDYCELNVCRREYLLNYFGENPSAPSKRREAAEDTASTSEKIESAEKIDCQGCDNCLTEQEEFDATIITQKILSAVLRTRARFGMNYVIKILRGSKSAQINDRGHDKLSVYGIVDDYSENDLKMIIKQLTAKKLLTKSEGEYPTLSVSRSGREFLKNNEKITLIKPKTEADTDRLKTKEIIEYDQELFSLLRALRKRIADNAGVPPFVIFGDVSLRQMAHYYPQSAESFFRISGVGQQKLQRFGEEFVGAIKKYAEENNIKEKDIPVNYRKTADRDTRTVRRENSTYNETKKLILEKLPIEEIAQRRGFTTGTITNHLEKLIESGEEFDIAYLKPSAERFEKIKTAFKKSGDTMLAPVREILGEEYSYNEIRFARLFL